MAVDTFSLKQAFFTPLYLKHGTTGTKESSTNKNMKQTQLPMILLISRGNYTMKIIHINESVFGFK